MTNSRLDLINRTYDKGKKPFRITLSEAGQVPLTLHHIPDGFIDNGASIYARNLRYFSVLRKTSKNELLFFKEGRKFIEDVYEADGIEANITLTVERLNKLTDVYEPYPFANKIDLSTYDKDEISVAVQMMDNSFLEKVINRSTSLIDVIKRISVDGTVLPAFTKDEFIIPDTSIDKEAVFTENGIGFILILEHVIPILMGATDFTETQTPAIGAGDVGKKTGSFVNTNTEQRIVTIDFDIQGQFIGDGNPFNPDVEIYITVIDNLEVEVDRRGIGSKTETGVTDMSFSFQKQLIFTLNVNESICLQAIINTIGKKFSYTVADVSYKEIYVGTPQVIVKGLAFYEFFLSILQQITDTVNPLQSTLLGRTDSDLTTYPSDGDGSLGFVTRGIYFRLARNLTNTIPSSLQNAFESVSSVFRIGMGYEVVGGVQKMVIEERDYFLKSEVMLDLSGRIRQEDIRKKTLPKDYFKTGQFGFNKFTYEENAGLYEFNTKSTWTTIIQSVFNDLIKVSKIRGDGQGMRQLINAPFETDYDSTADIRGDDDLFMVNCVREGPASFKARTNEGFSDISGSVYADASFNVWYSPARNLRRWGSELKAGLLKSITSVLRWQSADKNTTMSSQLSTEGSAVVENANIDAADLADTRYLLEELSIDAPISTIELNVVDADPNKLIKLSDTEYGWINNLKPSTEDQMVEFKLLRCNLAVVTPT